MLLLLWLLCRLRHSRSELPKTNNLPLFLACGLCVRERRERKKDIPFFPKGWEGEAGKASIKEKMHKNGGKGSLP